MTSTPSEAAGAEHTMLGQQIDALVERRRALRHFARWAAGCLRDAGAKLDQGFPGLVAAEDAQDITSVSKPDTEAVCTETARLTTAAAQCRKSLASLEQELMQARRLRRKRMMIGLVLIAVACLLLYAEFKPF